LREGLARVANPVEVQGQDGHAGSYVARSAPR
jgi:hypothetical protein